MNLEQAVETAGRDRIWAKPDPSAGCFTWDSEAVHTSWFEDEPPAEGFILFCGGDYIDQYRDEFHPDLPEDEVMDILLDDINEAEFPLVRA